MNNNARRRIELVKKAVKQVMGNKPTKATIYSLDGNLANIRIGQSPTLLKNVEVAGDPTSLSVGQEVSIQWVSRDGSFGPVPVVMTNAGSTAAAPATNVVVDNVTIINDAVGLEVKPGGIDLGRLAFTPALAGHTHKDIFQRAGWQVTSDGAIFNGTTVIHPNGQIALGLGNDIIKLDSENASYRLWAGNVNPALAPFSVQRSGLLHSIAGDIGGWSIGATQLTADSGQAVLDASSAPYFGLGGATAFGENGIWLGKDTDDIYKLYVGDPTNDHLYWDGTQLNITGVYHGIFDMSGTLSDIFTINEDRTDADTILQFGHPTADANLTWDGLQLVLDSPVKFSSDLTTYNLFPDQTDTYDIGSATSLYRQAWLSEIQATLFVENTVQAIGGSFVIPHLQGSLPVDLPDTSTAVDIDFGGLALSVNDFILLRGIGSGGSPQEEYLQVTADLGSGTFTVARDIDTSGPNVWPKGHVFLVYGYTGDGRIELDAQTNAPRISLIKQGSTYNAQTEFFKAGNMTGWQGRGLSGLGFGVGDATSFLYWTPGSGLIVAGDGSGITNIDGGHIQTNTITATQIAASTITATQIAASTITGGKIAAGTITATNIAASTITGAKIAASTITSDKISVSNLSAIKTTTGALTVNNTLTINASGKLTCGSKTWLDDVGLSLSLATGSTDTGAMVKWVSGSTVKGRLHYESSALLTGVDLWSDAKLWLEGNTGVMIAADSGDIDINGGAFTMITVNGGGVTFPYGLTSDGSIKFFYGATQVGDIGATNTTWLRINQSTAKNIYTPRMLRVDGGLVSGATTASGGQLAITGDAFISGSIFSTTSVGARVYRNSAQSIGANSYTPISFTTQRYDNDNIWSSGTNLNCQHGGTYYIFGNVSFAANANGVRRVYIRLNGATYIAAQSDNAPHASQPSNLNVSCIYPLSTGNTIQLVVYQNSGNPLNVNYSSAYSAEIGMVRIA